MHHLDLTRINYLAVAVAALAAFFIGAVWYTALFGKLWAIKHGYSPEQLQQMQARRPMPVFFAELIVCYFIAAMGLDILIMGRLRSSREFTWDRSVLRSWRHSA
jgi:hypothetical protein